MKKLVHICKHFFAPQTTFLIKRIRLSILFLVLCGSISAQSQGLVYITAPEVKDMVDKDPNVALINVLSTIEYDGLHITGSINIPINVFHNSDLLPKNLDTPLITYCMGKPWPYSARAARIATEMGYTKVYCFKGGIPEWRSFAYPMEVNTTYAKMKIRKISPRKLHAMLQENKDIYILDVRPIAYDRENIFIKKAEICPMVFLGDWYQNIPKDKQIVVTDWANKKAILAAKFLTIKGYKVLGILKGGIVRWREEQFPLEQRTVVDGLPLQENHVNGQ